MDAEVKSSEQHEEVITSEEKEERGRISTSSDVSGFSFFRGKSKKMKFSKVFRPMTSSSRHLLEGTMAVLQQAKLSSDVFHPLYLRFRDATIEKVFLNEHAIVHRRSVYTGYFIQLMLGCIGILIAQLIGMTVKVEQCVSIESPPFEVLCQKMLGNRMVSKNGLEALNNDDSPLAQKLLSDALNSNDTDKFFNASTDQFNSSSFPNTSDMPAWSIDGMQQTSQVASFSWMMLCVLIGTIGHWRIHYVAKRDTDSSTARESLSLGPSCSCLGFREVENKSRATTLACAVYTIEIIGFCALSNLIHNYDAYWEMRLLIWYTFVMLMSVWFTGILFYHMLLMACLSMICFYGFTLPILIANSNKVVGDLDEIEEIEPIFELILYSAVALLNAMFTGLMVASSYSNEMMARRSFLQEFMIKYQQDKMIEQKTNSQDMQRQMLNNILPPFVVEQICSTSKRSKSLKLGSLRSLSTQHDSVSILFADIVGFSSFAKEVDASTVMGYLNNLLGAFDDLCDLNSVYKVETIGDCYVAAVGLVTGNVLKSRVRTDISFTQYQISLSNSGATRSTLNSLPTAAYSRKGSSLEEGNASTEDVIASKLRTPFASMKRGNTSEIVLNAAEQNTKDMISFAKNILKHSKSVKMPETTRQTSLRVGVNTGPCLSGIVGTKRMSFCLLGESVDMAAKLEQTGCPNMIHASDIVRTLSANEPWKKKKKIKDQDQEQTYLLSEI